MVVGELLGHFMKNVLQFGVALPQSNAQKMEQRVADNEKSKNKDLVHQLLTPQI